MATVSSVIASVKSWMTSNLSKYLPLGGGKMTGQLTYVLSGLSIGTNPTAVNRKSIHWTDSTGDSGSNNRLATVEYSCDTNGLSELVLGPYQYIANRASYNGSHLKMSIASDGSKSIAWDGKPVVCVTKWTSGSSWYRKYSDGFIEQGGSVKVSNDNRTNSLSFPLAFSNANYTLTIGIVSTNTSSAGYVYSGVVSKSNTGFVYWANQSYITVGKNWHACGY